AHSLSHYARPRAPRPLHSFPTRRSSDLFTTTNSTSKPSDCPRNMTMKPPSTMVTCRTTTRLYGRAMTCRAVILRYSPDARKFVRSEEHTSELQSRENLVCRLLLEKKKNN